MNLILDIVPKTLNISGKDYKINTDFRNSILFEMVLGDRKLTNNEKIANGVNLYFPVVPETFETIEGYQETLDKMLWFYRCGKGLKELQDDDGNDKQEKIFCYEHDASYIYAAFMSQYGIDLQDEQLHWWKFNALFSSLNDDTTFMEILGYRAKTIDSDMSEEQKKFYREMKELYKIPDLRTPQEIEEDFNKGMSVMF